ncbi:MAG: hypothetical protein [Circoviridae sp.]|nr:MAG: hypothetical protein [Circoviridae sp.]
MLGLLVIILRTLLLHVLLVTLSPILLMDKQSAPFMAMVLLPLLRLMLILLIVLSLYVIPIPKARLLVLDQSIASSSGLVPQTVTFEHFIICNAACLCK